MCHTFCVTVHHPALCMHLHRRISQPVVGKNKVHNNFGNHTLHLKIHSNKHMQQAKWQVWQFLLYCGNKCGRLKCCRFKNYKSLSV